MTASLTLASWNVQAAIAPDSEIERLYVDGQDKYSDGDFAGAADAWTRLLDRMPEAKANRATRENVLLNVMQAHLDAYARTRRDDGSKDIGHLRSAKTVLDAYFVEFKQAYGDRAAVSAAVQEKADELDRTLEDAEKETAASAVDPVSEEPVEDPAANPVEDPAQTDPNGGGPKIIVLEGTDEGGGLIVGGAVAAGVSLAGFGMLTAGAVLASRATDDYNAATTEAERSEAEDQGTTGNALTITGAIVGPALLITGGVLIGLGFKRRNDAKAAREEQLRAISVVPTGGRGYGGLMLSGRF